MAVYVSVACDFVTVAQGWKHFIVTVAKISADREGRRHLVLIPKSGGAAAPGIRVPSATFASGDEQVRPARPGGES